MANAKKNGQQLTKRQAGVINRNNRRVSGNIHQLMDNLSTLTYGISRTDKVDQLVGDFNSLMKAEVETINRANDGDTTSFITKLVSENRKRIAYDMKNISEFFTESDQNIESFFNEQYKNRLLKQADLQEVTSQLVELQEAITITRDAIISADIVDGHMSRNLKITAVTEDGNAEQYMPILEKMEEQFELQEKIKNFIIPNSLTSGEYYSYTIPYSKVFEDFMREKNTQGGRQYRAFESVGQEHTLYEFVTKKSKNGFKQIQSTVLESVQESLDESLSAESTKEISSELRQYMENIIISNDPIPLPILEEGVESMRKCYQTYMEETDMMEAQKRGRKSFDNVMKGIDTGVFKADRSSKKDKDNDFSNIHDCYVKLIDAMHLLPIEIMNEPIGYYWIQEEDINPMSGILTSTVYYNKNEFGKRQNVLDAIAGTIVDAFDRKFLEKNEKFKTLIVEALSYYRLQNKRLKFQFIPREYIVPFKVNKDENGHGVSVIEPSLFYAKLYLMMLLFKIYSIVQNSNDTKVNYIRQSGIDKNVINKTQEIARKKQQQHIQLSDMFTYTTIINKIGRGSEMYVPMGKNNERTIETEILSGQDIPLHNELMDTLKKGYISGTGVPDVLLNYYNEADFAKTLELANNRFQGRVVSYQLDYSRQITKWYRMIARYATTIPENIIDSIEFSFIQPKSSNANITNDLLNNHNTLAEFLVNLYHPEQEVDPSVLKFRKALARDRLSMLNWDELDNHWKEAVIAGTEEELNPDKNTDETQ